MELGYLRDFVAVAEAKTFTLAVKRRSRDWSPTRLHQALQPLMRFDVTDDADGLPNVTTSSAPTQAVYRLSPVRHPME
jgi:hypothetical protein